MNSYQEKEHVSNPQEVVLHRAPLLLLEEILEATEEKCIARVKVDPEAWYADSEGAMPGWFGIELMAQTITAYSGSRKRLLGLPPRIGFNLGTRSYESNLSRFPGHAILEVEIQPQFVDPSGLSAFRCEIRHQGQAVARATVKTFEPA